MHLWHKVIYVYFSNFFAHIDSPFVAAISILIASCKICSFKPSLSSASGVACSKSAEEHVLSMELIQLGMVRVKLDISAFGSYLGICFISGAFLYLLSVSAFTFAIW